VLNGYIYKELRVPLKETEENPSVLGEFGLAILISTAYWYSEISKEFILKQQEEQFLIFNLK